MSDSSLVAKTFRGRLKADPSLSVGDLMDAFRAQFDEKGTRDIKKVLDPPADLGWKSAPVPRWLVKLFVLYSHLLDIAPNTLVTSKKLREALQRLHDVEPIHMMVKKEDSEVWDWADARVRIGLAQLRELKNNTHGAFDRAASRLPKEECSKLQTLLDKIQIGKDALALVPVVPTRSSSAGTARGRGEDADADPQDDSQQSASAVFEGILGSTSGRKRVLSSASSSDPKTPDKKVFFKPGHSNRTSTGMRRAKSRHDGDDGDDDDTEHSDDDSESTSSSSSYSDDDDGVTKIQILPAGQKLMAKHKKKKRDDKKKKKKNKNQSKKEKKQNKKDKKKQRKKKKDHRKTRTCDDMEDAEEMGCRAEVGDVPASIFDSLLSLMDDEDTPPRSKKQKNMTHMMEEKNTTDKKEKNKKKVKSQSKPHDQEEDLHSLSKVSGFCSSNLYVCLHPWKPV